IGYLPGTPQPGVPAPVVVQPGRFINISVGTAAFANVSFGFPHLQGDFASSLMTPSIVAPPTYPTFVSKIQLLGSQVLQNAQLNVTGDTNFINNLYQSVLGRPVETNGVNFWVQQLEAGASRYGVALAIWASPEHRGEQ